MTSTYNTPAQQGIRAAKAQARRPQTIKMVAFNPLSRRMEEVMPEDECELSDMSPRFWCGSSETFVSVPGYEAAWAYEEWIAQTCDL